MSIPQETNDYGVSDKEVDDLLEQFGDESPDGPTGSQDLEAPIEAAPQDDTSTQNTTEPAQKAVAETKPTAQVPEPPKEPEHEFTFNGQTIRAPLSKILKWAQQGYDYPQKMEALNRQREELTGIEQTYRPIDEWVRANPDKWEKLQAVIKAEQQGYGDLPPDHPVLQKLSKYDEVINKLETQWQTERVQKEDQELEHEIQSIRDKHKDLDWNTVDSDGRNREQKVLAHATRNGFKTFRSAFLDLYHDELLTSAETRARESFAAEKERQSKQGLLGKNTPAPSLKPAQKTKSKNYQDTESILAELGIR